MKLSTQNPVLEKAKKSLQRETSRSRECVVLPVAAHRDGRDYIASESGASPKASMPLRAWRLAAQPTGYPTEVLGKDCHGFQDLQILEDTLNI